MPFEIPPHPWQGMDLGTKMIDYMIEICKDKNLETVYGVMLPDNKRAINLMRKMGFNVKHLEDGTMKATLSLKQEQKFKVMNR